MAEIDAEAAARRAWIALYSLPERSPDGGHVRYDVLTGRSPLLNKGEINRFVCAEYSEPSYRVAQGVADVLGVDVAWLMLNRGQAPRVPVEFGLPPPWHGKRPSAPKRKGRRTVAERDPEKSGTIRTRKAR